MYAAYEYYLVSSDGEETKLGHIRKPGLDYLYLKQILPLDGTDIWIAFWLDKDGVTKHHVDINMIVFNERKVLHSNKVVRSKRVSTSNWENTQSYSIIPLDGNHQIKFETLEGNKFYQVKENLFL